MWLIEYKTGNLIKITVINILNNNFDMGITFRNNNLFIYAGFRILEMYWWKSLIGFKLMHIQEIKAIK